MQYDFGSPQYFQNKTFLLKVLQNRILKVEIVLSKLYEGNLLILCRYPLIFNQNRTTEVNQ